MDSAKLNDWMQVVGIFAVVASLIFVGLQMKQAQDIAVAAQYQERTASSIEAVSARSQIAAVKSEMAKIISDRYASYDSTDMSPEDHPTGSGDHGDEIAIGADHGGYALKQTLAGYLRERGYRVNDCGTDGGEAVDYPDFARAVAQAVAGGSSRWGIVIDGAGIGSCMAANKSLESLRRSARRGDRA